MKMKLRNVTRKTFVVFIFIVILCLVCHYLYSRNLHKGTSKNDGKLLRNLYPGGFSLPGVPPCREHLNLLIIVHSAPLNSESRHAIRKTWGAASNLPPKTRILFLIGESEHFIEPQNDIIYANFIDSYNNLTLKSISMLEWTIQNCPDIDYLLKIDDDVFLNVENLHDYLITSSFKNNKIVGRLRYDDKPIRWNIFHKNYISHSQYSDSVYPTYATGPAYLMSGNIIRDLFNVALNQTWFQNEDIFITGIVGSQKLGLSLLHNSKFHNEYGKFVPVRFAHKFITIHEIEPWNQNKYLFCSKFQDLCFKTNSEFLYDFFDFLSSVFLIVVSFFSLLAVVATGFVFISKFVRSYYASA